MKDTMHVPRDDPHRRGKPGKASFQIFGVFKPDCVHEANPRPQVRLMQGNQHPQALCRIKGMRQQVQAFSAQSSAALPLDQCIKSDDTGIAHVLNPVDQARFRNAFKITETIPKGRAPVVISGHRQQRQTQPHNNPPPHHQPTPTPHNPQHP
ncbi:MAG: hypothetical protein LPK16_07330, partial [Rhodobacterales bacterium]|nr:hypothetical protein [Rhodobacterales bacterium]MDX5390141.1 hypothetical protein [Rhodobacterales bacterium]